MNHTTGPPRPEKPEADGGNNATALRKRHFSPQKLIVLAMLLAVGGYLLVTSRDQLSLERLADNEVRLNSLRDAKPILVYGSAYLLYVAVTGLSLPLAVPLSLAYGWLFGFLPAVVLVSFGSTTGSTLAFLTSRYLFRDAVEQQFGDRLVRINEALERDGAFYLFMLRLAPVVPFFMINLAMGLTPMRARTFWWVSQAGMLPGTCVYVWAGSQFPSLHDLATQGFRPGWKILVAFALLGLFPLMVRKLRIRREGGSQQ